MSAIATAVRSIPAPAAEQAAHAVREHLTWSPGDAAHQGDLILICLPSLPKSAKPRVNRQMAEGETMGSRHIVNGSECYDVDAVKVAEMIAKATKGRCKPAAQYVGPVFVGSCVLEHPQHQHQAFPAGTVTVCVFQRNQTADDRELRAQD